MLHLHTGSADRRRHLGARRGERVRRAPPAVARARPPLLRGEPVPAAAARARTPRRASRPRWPGASAGVATLRDRPHARDRARRRPDAHHRAGRRRTVRTRARGAGRTRSAPAPVPAPPAPPAPAPVSARTHVVVPGDNLWRIATDEARASQWWWRARPMRRSFRTGARSSSRTERRCARVIRASSTPARS